MSELEKLLDFSNTDYDYTKELYDKAFSYRDIVIFGAGFGGTETFNILEAIPQFKGRIKAFSDNNKTKIGTLYHGLRVIDPNDITSLYPEALILISSTAFDIIKSQLIKFGISPKDIFFFQPCGLSITGEDVSFIKDHINDFSTAYDLLCDDESKSIFSGLLKYRISKKQDELELINEYLLPEREQYFDKRLLDNYRFNTGFIDGGAYTGDTLSEFFRQYPDWSGTYHCFEADPLIADQLEKTIAKSRNGNVYLHRFALWNTREHLKFDISSGGHGAGSRVSSEGIDVIADSIDNILSDQEINFIKMDIEGAEHNALLGASETIRKHKPILTICIYHKAEDFYDIPNLIEELCPNEYSYYVRQYRYGFSETVLYALPKSRKIED